MWDLVKSWFADVTPLPEESGAPPLHMLRRVDGDDVVSAPSIPDSEIEAELTAYIALFRDASGAINWLQAITELVETNARLATEREACAAELLTLSNRQPDFVL